MDNQHNHTTQNSSTHLQNGRNLNTHVETVNPESISYEDGYVHGRAAERSYEYEHQDARAENSAARGLILGFLLTSLVGLVVGAIFYFNQRQESQTPVLVPVPSTSQPQNRETKIIQKTTERTQSSAPTSQQPSTGSQQRQPDIKIIVPNSSGQQSSSSQKNTTSQTTPTQTPNQPSLPSTRTQPKTTNQSSQTPSQIEIPTVTTKTESSDTTTGTSTDQSQNQTQSDNSSSAK